MTVYVDDSRGYATMIADTHAELENMARLLSIPRKESLGDHYILNATQRETAILFGARQLTKSQVDAMTAIRRLNYSNEYGNPDDVELRLYVMRHA